MSIYPERTYCPLRDVSPFFAAYEVVAHASIMNIVGILPAERIRNYFSQPVLYPDRSGVDDHFREIVDECYLPWAEGHQNEPLYTSQLINELAEIVCLSIEAGANKKEVLRDLHYLATTRPDNQGWKEKLEEFRTTW